jgi:ubiquinone biosynthesis UbiH/UbiF/VisC/COQ6 family hydroxylase
MSNYDIIIAGAGPAGLSFSRSLANSGLKVLLVEKAPEQANAEPAPDGREIALTHLSQKILQRMGAWQRLQDVAPLKAAKVMNGGSAYTLDFDKPDNLEALGFLAPNYRIREALYAEVMASVHNVEYRFGTGVESASVKPDKVVVGLSDGNTVEARLLVAADSRFSKVRDMVGMSATTKQFSRTAIVCRMEHEKPNFATAVECFLYGRTMAILPMNGNMSSIVITVSSDKAQSIAESNEEEFNADTARWLKQRLGPMKLVGKRHVYPLVSVFADQFVKPRVALLGDAAVGMHPVTAHGFNLGLRGQDSLATAVINAHQKNKDIGELAVLEEYADKHILVAKPLYLGTNTVVGLFTAESYPARMMRDATLHIANHLKPLKWLINKTLTETGAVVR